MNNPVWESAILPEETDGLQWQIFHENSKLSQYEQGVPTETVQQRMRDMTPSLAYETLPATALPDARLPLQLNLDELTARRATPPGLRPRRMSLACLSTLLYHAYGVTRSNEGNPIFPRPFRSVPSAGALYPLELYFHSIHIDGLKPGLYHYSSARHEVRLLKSGDQSRGIAAGLVQKALAADATIMIFITGLFERVTFKYKDRGYRFTLLEAGHVAQNINLAGLSLGESVFNLGGFFDRQIDEFLGLDGVKQSTVYLVALGQPGEAASGAMRLS